MPSAPSKAAWISCETILGSKAVLLATVVAGPDLQKVKNNVILARPRFICTCAHTHVQTHASYRQRFLLRLWGCTGRGQCSWQVMLVRVPSTVYEFFCWIGESGGGFLPGTLPSSDLELQPYDVGRRPLIPCCWASGMRPMSTPIHVDACS